MFDQINVMLAKTDGKYLEFPGYISEQKYDGTRCVIIKKGQIVRLFGRSWNEYTSRYPKIIAEARKLRCKTCVLDSELTFFKDSQDIFITALATPETKKNYIIKLMVFDVLEIDGYNVRGKTLL
jgi:bifunctional non-homologous end joining protein LigD